MVRSVLQGLRILFLTPQVPFPPRQGATIRNFNLLAQLSARHVIDLDPDLKRRVAEAR